jgi:uncharacterized protein YecE (DUF72 family)
MTHSGYYLGCPIWSCHHWTGTLYPRDCAARDYLRFYSRVFTAVEGNSTFYGLPRRDQVRRWADETPDGFRFALKFPQKITHRLRLLNAQSETDAFLDVLRVIGDGRRSGPAFLQLPSGFSPFHLDDLAAYLRQLPREYPYAVEVRHVGFFDQGPDEHALNQLLEELGVNRVMFDSRPLFSAPAEDPTEEEAQSRKPRLPVHAKATARHPLIRLVGCNDVTRALPWIRDWAAVIARWITAGLEPFVFTHTPADIYAPQLARLFHSELMQHADGIAPLPPWPGEHELQSREQLELF